MPDSIVLDDIVGGGWRHRAFEPFRDGIEICHVLAGEPAVAILRYSPGATVPPHEHVGLETVMILEGSQRDDNGVYGAGTVILNREGSRHAVASDEGCVVLIQWAKPIRFLGDDAAGA